jgi:hypothetical protein
MSGRTATIHFTGGDSQSLHVGDSFVLDGETYTLTAKGLREMMAGLVAAGYLTPTAEAGHYDATIPRRFPDHDYGGLPSALIILYELTGGTRC